MNKCELSVRDSESLPAMAAAASTPAGPGQSFFTEKANALQLKLDKLAVALSGKPEEFDAASAPDAAASSASADGSGSTSLPPAPPTVTDEKKRKKTRKEKEADDERPAMQAPTQSQIRKMVTKLVTDARAALGWEEGLVEVSLHNKSRPVREVERTFRKMGWDFERNKEVPAKAGGRTLELEKVLGALISLHRYFRSEGDAELLADGDAVEVITRRAKGASVASKVGDSGGADGADGDGDGDGAAAGGSGSGATPSAAAAANAALLEPSEAELAAAKKAKKEKKKKKKKKKIRVKYAVNGSKSGGLPVLVEKRKHGRLVTIIQNISGEAKELLKELKDVLGAGGSCTPTESADEGADADLYEVIIQVCLFVRACPVPRCGVVRIARPGPHSHPLTYSTPHAHCCCCCAISLFPLFSLYLQGDHKLDVCAYLAKRGCIIGVSQRNLAGAISAANTSGEKRLAREVVAKGVCSSVVDTSVTLDKKAIKKMNPKTLKAHLESRGLSTQGNKKVLATRLIENISAG